MLDGESSFGVRDEVDDDGATPAGFGGRGGGSFLAATGGFAELGGGVGGVARPFDEGADVTP